MPHSDHTALEHELDELHRVEEALVAAAPPRLDPTRPNRPFFREVY
jgi:hypothetical protein